MELEEAIRSAGLSEKAAKLYLAALELGEATIQELAKRSKLKRTTVYYILGELFDFGALIMSKRGKKEYYVPEEPRVVLKRARERLGQFEDALGALEERKHAIYPRPRVFFLYGIAGFKQMWEMVFKSAEEEYLIMTPGENFTEFVKESYIEEEIIKNKRRYGLTSRQLITDSPYARKVVAKDMREGRSSKLLPARYPLVFTEIVTSSQVVLVSPRIDNLIMVIESDSFAKTRRSAFNILWNALPPR